MKRKIKLEQLKVQSFITELEAGRAETLKGGAEIALTRTNCESLVLPTQCCTGMYPSINYPCTN